MLAEPLQEKLQHVTDCNFTIRTALNWKRLFLPRPARLLLRIAILAGALPIIGWIGGRYWLFDLLNHFQIQYVAALILCVTLFLILRSYRLAGIATIGLVVPILRILSSVSPHVDPPVDEVNIIRICSFNVLTSNTRYADTVDWLQRSDADVIFLPEADEVWAEALSPLRVRYPHVIENYPGGNFGLVLFSRLPITDQQIIYTGKLHLPILRVRINGPTGDFIFYGAHPIPPIGALNAADRDTYLARIATLASGDPLPVVVAGDFNATPWSHSMKPLFASGLSNTDDRLIPSSTWNRTQPLVAIPIDHILFRDPRMTSDPSGAFHFKVGPDLGSDHRPILADFIWPPQEADSE